MEECLLPVIGSNFIDVGRAKDKKY